MVRGQAAVLHGIGEGVLAVDTSWKTTFVNDEACRLLELDDERGRPVEEIGLTPRVLDVFKSADPAPTIATVGDRIVVVSARTGVAADTTSAPCLWCAIAPTSNP